MNAGPLARIAGAVVIAVVVQHGFLVNLRVGSVHPDVMLLLPIVIGMAGGPERGAALGFIAGLAADLFLETPFGLSSLAFSIVGFTVGSVQAGILRAVWWMPPLTALAASASGVALYAVLGFVVGQANLVTPRLGGIVLVVAIANAILCLPALRLAAWATAEPPPARSYAR